MSAKHWQRTVSAAAAAAVTIVGTAWAQVPGPDRKCGTTGATAAPAADPENRGRSRVGPAGRLSLPPARPLAGRRRGLAPGRRDAGLARRHPAPPTAGASSTPPAPQAPPAVPGLPPPPTVGEGQEGEGGRRASARRGHPGQGRGARGAAPRHRHRGLRRGPRRRRRGEARREGPLRGAAQGGRALRGLPPQEDDGGHGELGRRAGAPRTRRGPGRLRLGPDRAERRQAPRPGGPGRRRHRPPLVPAAVHG